jgi:hypothetical protein
MKTTLPILLFSRSTPLTVPTLSGESREMSFSPGHRARVLRLARGFRPRPPGHASAGATARTRQAAVGPAAGLSFHVNFARALSTFAA